MLAMRKMTLRQFFVITAATLLAPALAMGEEGQQPEKVPAGLKVVGIAATPESIELDQPFAYEQFSPSHQGRGLARALLAAAEERIRSDGGRRVYIETSSQAKYEPSFVRDIMPALSKLGCNAGTCHGSKDGQNGFKLSLRGYDPLFDHRALTDDVAARRFNRAAPDQSLMLLKTSGGIPHTGGALSQPGEPHYELLRAWIAAGVKLDLDSPRVKSIRIHPTAPILPRAGMRQQFKVIATYSDGSERDVTREAFITSGDIEIAAAEEHGVVKTLRRGEAPILARYEGAYAAATLTVMGDRSGFTWKDVPPNNYIDEHVYAKLKRMKIAPSELCTDEEFVRRVYLDLTGLPPTVEQVKAFLEDERPTRQKRNALVDRLVGSGEYVEYWTNKWADLLQVNRKFLGEPGVHALRNWIKDQVASNTPYDKFVYEILTGSGSNVESPAAAYWKILREPTDAMENSTHLFLGVRFNCNKCHDHPFEKWTQDQYYDMAAYFAQVGFKPDPKYKGKKLGGTAVEGAKPLVEVVYDRGTGEVKHQRTGQTAKPHFPYQPDLVSPEGTRREQLARWITSPENRYFARSYVNRLWGYLLGRGLITPIDDIRAGNPPTNPELLDALEQDFLSSGFDIQHIMRTICKSRTYQHSIRTNKWNEDDRINYSHFIPKRLPAEVLFDAIYVATGSQTRLPGVPAGTRAAELPDVGVKVPFLDDFGRPVRESACECERSDTIVLGPIMKLINGPTVAKAVSDPGNDIAKLVANEKDDGKLIEQMFLRFFARYPTEKELAVGRLALKAAGGEKEKAAQALADYKKQLPAKQAQWEKQAGTPTAWTPLTPKSMDSSMGATFKTLPDGSILVSGKTGKGTYTITAEMPLKRITGLKLEALPHDSLPANGPGRARNGNFVVSEIKLAAAEEAEGKFTPLQLSGGQADFSQSNWHVRGAVDGNRDTGWAVSPQFGKAHVAVFDANSEGSPAVVRITMDQQFHDGQHLLGRFRLSVTDSSGPIQLKSSLPPQIATLLETPADERTPAQKSQLADYYKGIDPEYARLSAALQRAEDQSKNQRLIGAQDLAWAMINNASFLFNR